MQASKLDLASALKADSGGVIGGHRRGLARSALVVVQVSLSFILLVGAVLVIRSLRAIENTNPGFAADGVLTSSVDLVSAGYDVPRMRNFQDALAMRLQAIGGVTSVAWTRIVPFSFRGYFTAPIRVDGYDAARDEDMSVDYNDVGAGYLGTLGIPLVSGRDFNPADNETAPLVAIINEAMAARYWRGRDPVGSRVEVKGRWMRVVGVAKMAKYRNLSETPKPFFYVPMRQNAPGVGLLIRTSLPAQAMSKILVQEIRSLDANLAPLEVITMREQVDRTAGAQHLAVVMLGVFGALAVLLASIGLYGVMSYTVAQSTREIGLRMALGADARDLLRLVMSHGMGLCAVGVVLGAGAALMSTRLMGNLLYRVSPRDPLAFGTALVVLAIAGLLACYVPARRAIGTDPLRALRD